MRKRPPQQPDHLHGRRQAVHRRAGRLGWMGRGVPARDARRRPRQRADRLRSAGGVVGPRDRKTGGDPVEAARTEWETPEFDEIGCAPEVTMYVARMDD